MGYNYTFDFHPMIFLSYPVENPASELLLNDQMFCPEMTEFDLKSQHNMSVNSE